MQLNPLIHRLGLSLFLLTFATLTFAQQTGSIKGHFTTSDTQIHPKHTIDLKGISTGTHKNDNGDFQLRGKKMEAIY